MSLATVVAGSSVWTNQFSPDKVMPQSDNLYVGTTAGQTRYGLGSGLHYPDRQASVEGGASLASGHLHPEG